MIRDVCLCQVFTVLTSGPYAVPALIGAAIVVVTIQAGVYGSSTRSWPRWSACPCGCWVRFDLHAPAAPGLPKF